MNSTIYNTTIIKRKNIINDTSFLDSAHKENEGRIVVFDYAIDNFVDKLAPNIKDVVDKNYDQFVMKTKEVAVEIKKLQRQIKWEQEVFNQIERDLDSQPVLQDLHKEIKKYTDIYQYYQQYMDEIKNHIQVEEKKLVFMREQYKQLKVVSQQQNNKKMTGLVKYFRERLALFQFSHSKNSPRSPQRNESRQQSPQRRRDEYLNEDLNSKSIQQATLPNFRRNRQSSLAVSNDQEILISDRSHLNSSKNTYNRSELLSSEQKNIQKQNPRMIFSLKSSPKNPQKFRATQYSGRKTQSKGFYPSISSSIKQDYSVLSDAQQIKMISYSSPMNEINVSGYKQLANNLQPQTFYQNKLNENNSSIFVKNSNNLYSLKGNSIDLGVKQQRYDENTILLDSSYQITPQRQQKSPGYRHFSDKFRSTQASPINSLRESSLVSQNSIINSINVNSKQKQSNDNESNPPTISKLSLSKNNEFDQINFSIQYDSKVNNVNNNIQQQQQKVKILEFDNTIQQFPIIFDKSKDLELDGLISKNENNKTQINFNKQKRFKNNQSILQQQGLLQDKQQEEDLQQNQKMKQELNQIQKQIQLEKLKSQQIKNNILQNIKQLNKIDSILNESFKSVQKYVEKKIDSQEFNEQFCTQKFLDILDALEQEKKPRMGLFSQQKKHREKKQDLNLILSEEDLEKISERDERSLQNDYDSQQRLSINLEDNQKSSMDNLDQEKTKKIRVSSLSIKSIIEIQQQQQQKEMKQSQDQFSSLKISDSTIKVSPRQTESIFNKIHFFDFQQLKSFQLFFLLIKDESLMGKFFLQNFLKRKRALQIFAQSKQY